MQCLSSLDVAVTSVHVLWCDGSLLVPPEILQAEEVHRH